MEYKVNEIKISYKERVPAPYWRKINGSGDAAELLYGTWDRSTIGLCESFKVMLLNNANKVKGIHQVSQGGITGTMVDLRILFAVALKSLSVGVILAHCHPSGNLRPSHRDIELTKKIVKAARLFDIVVLDHIILAPNGDFYSFADEGLI